MSGLLGMSAYDAALLDCPSIEGDACCICGRPATNRHHVVFKGIGGVPAEVEARIPTVPLCGMGNVSGCHGAVHRRTLHLRYRDGWEYCRTARPTSYGMAMEFGAWRKVGFPQEEGRRQ